MSTWEVDMGDYRKTVSVLGLMLIYARDIDKQEYPDFEGWKADMLRCGLIKEVR